MKHSNFDGHMRMTFNKNAKRVQVTKTRTRLPFTKMHGCGNDYIYFSGFDLDIPSPESLAVRLSDRHKGIGGDGIVLMLPSTAADAKMRMFNLDGSEGSMCGNAIRCVAKYLYDNDIVKKRAMKIETLSGVKTLTLATRNGAVASVKVDMGCAELRPEKIPVRLTGDSVVARAVTVGGTKYAMTCVSMGNPHAVIFCKDVDALDVPRIGPLFENAPLFPDRVNTEFVEAVNRNQLKMRVWERGSGETQACGTGACAAAVAAVLNGLCDKDTDISVQLLGGTLTIRYTGKTVYMTGGCTTIFEGTVEL